MIDEYRLERIISIFPENIETVLDIGCKNTIFNKKYKTTTIDVIEDADIVQDLNKNQKINLPDNSYDIVVLNQILEHLVDVDVIINEAKRISKRYIYIGLPNELTYGARIRFLIGKPLWKGYMPFWHKHFFTLATIESFISKFFAKYSKKQYYFACSGSRFIPTKIRTVLADNFPKLCAKEVYYLIDLYNSNKKVSC